MKKLFVSYLSVFLFTFFFLSTSSSAIKVQQNYRLPNPKVSAIKSYGITPLSIIQNNGQLTSAVLYYIKGERGSIYFTKEGVIYNLLSGAGAGSPSLNKHRINDFKGLSFSMKPLGVNKNVRLFSRNTLPGRVNYFIGNNPKNWRTDIPTYKEIIYKNIYHGIDMKIYGNNTRMEYDLIVSPGTDPSDITMSFEGINGLNVDEDGNLLIMTPLGVLKHMKPLSYQEIDGKRHMVTCHYVISKNNFSFHLGDYDNRYSLVIDPLTSSYSTYLGGSGSDYARSIAIDVSGNAYVTGSTASDDFPMENAYQEPTSGVFVTKLNPNGDTLIYSTYLGGSGVDFSYGITVDSSGSAHVTGWAYSDDFPTKNAFQETRHGKDDAFVAKLSPSGNDLSFSTYLGGNGTDIPYSIAVDSSGSTFVTGVTYSDDFPVHNALQETFGGGYNTFVTKFNQGGDTVAYSTYIGGTSLNEGRGIAVDASGSAYITGSTHSGNFPTKNAFQDTDAGGYGDAFVVKLTPSGSSLSYSTYLGGSSSDEGFGIAVDASGNAYVTGGTDSDDFPTQNAYQGTSGGGPDEVSAFYHIDVFVTKLRPNGNSLGYSTYLGGSDREAGNAIAIDASGCAHVTGYTYSSDFPVKGEYQATLRGPSDVFYTKLDPNGDTVASSTYLGGNSWDEGSGIAVDASGNVFITGKTDSEDFPTKNAFQGISGGGRDAFIAKLTERETQVLYVDNDVSASGNGQTWSEAFKTVQEAMDAASGGDDVWVKKGTYLLSAQIDVDKAVGIYGGFNGDEIQRDERNWETNVTTIDGQSAAYHCFSITADATIDGLTITRGNANGDSPDYRGGGLYIYQSFPTITNCTFADNTADYGGALYNRNSSPNITNCTFTKNNAVKSGGGIYNTESSPTITTCTLSGNSASSGGGGMYNNESSPTFTNCTLSGNTAVWGGGIYNNESSPTFTNCSFSANSASNYGGGIENVDSSPTITNCILWGNTAPNGPEIYDANASSPTVTYCDIQGGYTGTGNIDSDPLFVDPENDDFHLQATSPCIDTGNNSVPDIPSTDFEGDPRIADGDNDGTATVDVGADEYAFIDTDSDGMPDDWESSYFGDLTEGAVTDYDGDGISNIKEYQARTNPANAAPQADAGIDQNVDEGVTVTLDASDSSDADGTISSYLWTQIDGTAVTLSDKTVAMPTFTAPNVDPAGEILTFQVTVTDNNGEQAVDTCSISITWINLPQYVDGDITGSGSGTSWDTAFKTIQEAVNAAGEGDEIWLMKGTYHLFSQINVNKAISIYGGFKGDETKKEDRDWAKNTTIVDGKGSVFHCFFISKDATIDGLTITGGNANASWPDNAGGGISIEKSSPSINNCNISKNSARWGGGIQSYQSSPAISNCTLSENTAANSGGALYNNESPSNITNCTISQNTADWGGGIYNNSSSGIIAACAISENTAKGNGGSIYNNESSPTINNCTISSNNADWGGAIFNEKSSPTIATCSISGNTATNNAGSICNSDSSPTITNCTISTNNAPYGAGIYNYASSSPTITNCTLSGNSSTGGGGGMRSKESSAPTVTNSIFWNNTAPHGAEIYNDDTSNPKITHCDIQGGYSGEGNIDSDPLFYDPLKNDFHITSSSPCIDNGYNRAAGIQSTDFDGDPRIVDGNHDGTAKADIGADEYADTDSDGMPDYWEVKYFNDLSRNPNADYDGDGLTNVEEYYAGTDPASKADGDVAPLGNRDGKVNVGDALVALRFALGLETASPEDISHGDVAPLDAENKPKPDGQITVGDALVILRKALNIISF